MTEAAQRMMLRRSQQPAQLTRLEAEGVHQRMQILQLKQAPRVLGRGHALGVNHLIAPHSYRARRMPMMCGSRQRSTAS